MTGATKACVYCLEEIPNEALVCRSCARPYITDVQKIAYLGRVMALGKSSEGYAMWNMVTGGQPVKTYKENPAGWNRAWTNYISSEQKASGMGSGWFVGGFFVDFG